MRKAVMKRTWPPIALLVACTRVPVARGGQTQRIPMAVEEPGLRATSFLRVLGHRNYALRHAY